MHFVLCFSRSKLIKNKHPHACLSVYISHPRSAVCPQNGVRKEAGVSQRLQDLFSVLEDCMRHGRASPGFQRPPYNLAATGQEW